MAKIRKLRRDLTPWTKTQLQERKRRRMMRDRMMFGMPTPKGTPPRQFSRPGEPVLKPMPRPGLSFDFIWGLVSLLPWLGMRRRRREAQLAEERRSQSMKAKERRI